MGAPRCAVQLGVAWCPRFGSRCRPDAMMRTIRPSPVALHHDVPLQSIGPIHFPTGLPEGHCADPPGPQGGSPVRPCVAGSTFAGSAPGFADVRFTPHYPLPSPLTDILRFVAPGSDAYLTEKYATEIESALNRWGQGMKASPQDHSSLAHALHPSVRACAFRSASERTLRSAFGVTIRKRRFDSQLVEGRDQFVRNVAGWLGDVSRMETAEFEIFGIRELSGNPALGDRRDTLRPGHRTRETP